MNLSFFLFFFNYPFWIICEASQIENYLRIQFCRRGEMDIYVKKLY